MVQKQEFYRQTIQEAAASLHTDPKRGLSAPEAERRLWENGENRLPEAEKKSVLQSFLEQLNDPLIYVLLAAALISVLLGEYSDKTADRVEKLENQIDQYEDALGTYLVKLSGRELSIKDSRVLSVLLHCIGDFERISDHAVNIRDAAVEMHKKDLKFSEKAKQELRVFSNAIRDILDRAVMAFETGDVELAKEVEPLEQVVDALNKEEKQRHINRLRTGTCTIELGFILSDISTNFERAADHCSNIAVCLLQVDEGGFDTHEYLDILKEENSEEFQHEYMELSERYALPESKHTGKKEKIAKTEKMEARKDSGK